ncbi:choice-of-anchor Q domain-containing protein [Pseudopedobacter beijingensis]|uniref:Choice-of-anchor Q domain-containing protein n=1 Tax=Pseudopedobacter beijingensis TaxID=1207056 RepID=A0ABW4IHM6_9SPHI
MKTLRPKKILNVFLYILLTLFSARAQIVPTNSIVYVKENATGNGSSWSNATDLAIALQWAQTNKDNNLWNNNNPLKIYVAKGEYRPSIHPGTNNTAQGKYATFLMVKNVQLYGGFPNSGEPTIENRDWEIHKTILKGRTPNGSEAFHVIVSAGDVGTALVDGFTVTGGNANGSSAQEITVNDKKISAINGGGILNYSSSPTFTNVIISGNRALNGAGISCLWSSSKFTNAIIRENKASKIGGGIRNHGGNPSLTNVLINGNTADESGGGLYYTSSLILTNVTMVNNGSGSSGLFGYGNPSLKNSIIWDIIVDNSYSAQNCLIKDKSTTANGNIDAIGITARDIFTNPANNDFTLKSTSPALNAGSNFLLWEALRDKFSTPAPSPEAPAWGRDLSGNKRLFGEVVDLGAYEYQGAPTLPIMPDAGNILYVNQNIQDGNGSGDSWVNALSDLAPALQWAEDNKHNNLWNSSNPLKIYVAKGEYKPSINPTTNNIVQDKNATFLMVKNVQLYGGFPDTGEPTIANRDWQNNTTILKGETPNGTPVFHVVLSVDNVGTALLNGFTITHGMADGLGSIAINGKTISHNQGGGMYNHFSSPILFNVIFSANTAKFSGGGIYNADSNPELINVAIYNNTADIAGGGIYNDNSSPLLTNVAIKGNNAKFGGGIANITSFPKLTNVAITGNTATTNGGGIYNSNSSPVLTNITLSGNQTKEDGGGGIYNTSSGDSSSLPVLTNSIIWGNKGGDIVNLGSNGLSESGNNLIGRGDDSNIPGDYTGLLASDIFVDYKPAIAENPTTDGDYSLKISSPAIAKGSNVYYTQNGGNPNNDKDLADNPRVYNYSNGGTIDIGAYEYQGLLPQSINFSALPAKSINDTDFDLTATASSGLTVSYTSNDTEVINISDHTISLIGAGSAVITASQSGNGDYEPAVSVQQTLVVNGTLPVILTDFTATAQGNRTKLIWQTAQEANNKEFIIYRSTDSKQFTEITRIAGAGNSSAVKNYDYDDENPLNGNNYYKLVQIDLDNKETELGIRIVSFELTALSLQLYPNPTDDVVNISFYNGKYDLLTVTDLSGKVLQQVQIKPDESSIKVSLGNYPAGIYLLHFSGNDDTITEKVMKK